MAGKIQVLVMSFDGAFKIESPLFNNFDDAWLYADSLSSKWFFYPFVFLISGKTIKDSPADVFNNKRITTISKKFNKTHLECLSKDLNLNPYEFIKYLIFKEAENGMANNGI
jgi:hypothetical protein